MIPSVTTKTAIGKNSVITGVNTAKSLYGALHSYFTLASQLGHASLGLKIVLDNHNVEVLDLNTLEGKDYNDWKATFSAMRAERGALSSEKINGVNGGLLLAGGAIGAVSALDHWDFLTLGQAAEPILFASNSLFFTANLVSLYQSVSILRSSLTIMLDGGSVAKPARCCARSAALGIVSSLSYLFLDLSLVFGASQAFIIVFGGLAALTGCLRWLYDYFVVEQAWNQIGSV